MDEALYERDGDRYIPTEHTRGPWDLSAQHGGAPSALIGREIERLPVEAPMQVVRVTIELLRPLPLKPLRVEAGIVRPGRRVQLSTAAVYAGAEAVARATAWRIRTADVAVPQRPAGTPIPPPESVRPFRAAEDLAAMWTTAMEMRFVRGGFYETGDSTVWFRMRVPLVAGETTTPLQRVLAAADFGNGVSAAIDWGRFVFINTDLTVHLHRYPVDEWVCLESSTVVQQSGIGLAQSALSDRGGPIGRSLQSLLVDVRQG